jgi:hypothetical protein
VQANEFFEIFLRDGVPLACGGNDQAGDDGQRQRNSKREEGARSAQRLDFERSAELVEIRLDDVHAHAAAGDIRHLLGGGESGQEDQP